MLALDDGFYTFDFGTGKIELIALVDAEEPRTRLNDGKCDRRGRFSPAAWTTRRSSRSAACGGSTRT